MAGGPKACRVGSLFGALVCCALIAASCSSDSEDPAIPASPEMVSDVGELVETYQYDEGDLQVYEFEELRFYGDIAVSEYRVARADVLTRVVAGEALIQVRNFREFPTSTQYGEPGDSFDLLTCTDENPVSCEYGRWYRYIVSGGNVEFLAAGWWRLIPLGGDP